MKRLIVAAGFSAALLWTFVDSSLAATVTFTGVIDEVSGQPSWCHDRRHIYRDLFFSIRILPDTFGHFGGLMGRFSIAIGDLMVCGTAYIISRTG